jgi:hypothetical protein
MIGHSCAPGYRRRLHKARDAVAEARHLLEKVALAETQAAELEAAYADIGVAPPELLDRPPRSAR